MVEAGYPRSGWRWGHRGRAWSTGYIKALIDAVKRWRDDVDGRGKSRAGWVSVGASPSMRRAQQLTIGWKCSILPIDTQTARETTMPIPAFQADGYLPEGVHMATEEEVTARFGQAT